MFEENNQEKRMNKSLIYAVAGVALLVIAITGSAYAYFSASATNTNAITGKTLDVQLSIASLRKVSKGTGDLIPIYDGTVTGHTTNQLTTAISTTNDCVDKNNYTVCQVYELVINNGGIYKIMNITEEERGILEDLTKLDNIIQGMRNKLRYGEKLELKI